MNAHCYDAAIAEENCNCWNPGPKNGRPEYTAIEYKEHKGLAKKDSLRDNMTPLELATTIFNEATTTEILKETGAKGFIQTKNVIHVAGNITKEAIQKIEEQTGKKVVTHKNAKELDSPEIRKELAQQSSTHNPEETEENLSEIDKSKKRTLNPTKKGKK